MKSKIKNLDKNFKKCNPLGVGLILIYYHIMALYIRIFSPTSFIRLRNKNKPRELIKFSLIFPMNYSERKNNLLNKRGLLNCFYKLISRKK